MPIPLACPINQIDPQDRICRFWKHAISGLGRARGDGCGLRLEPAGKRVQVPLAARQKIEWCVLPAPIQFDRLRVVLVAARNPLNIGAAARAMSNFGFRSLRVVNPFEPSFREARSAVGASEILAQAEFFQNVADAVADCTLVVGTTAVRNRELQHPVRRPEYAARLIRKRMGTGGVALLFGSEKFGLSNEDLSHCHWLIRIPTCDENISMNLGQAVAVCLYELIRDSKCERSTGQPAPATSAELERITSLLLEALHTSGFLERRRVNDADERIRRLVRRLHLPERDAVIWLGILRQMLWKMNAEKDPESGLTPAPVSGGRRKKTAAVARTPLRESPK
jgi:TrmH family RNA methyltransferase